MNKPSIPFLPGALLAAACAAGAASAQATPFVGTGSPGPLVVTATGNLPLNGSGGSAAASASSLVLTSGNAEPAGCLGGVYEVRGPCQVQAVYAVPGSYSFTWSYTTADSAGPGGDLFGVLVDGVPFTLSDLGGAVSQGGTTQPYVARSTFGWFLNCTDCTGGSATVTISALAVPEPSAWALMLAGGAAVASRVWRRRRAR